MTNYVKRSFKNYLTQNARYFNVQKFWHDNLRINFWKLLPVSQCLYCEQNGCKWAPHYQHDEYRLNQVTVTVADNDKNGQCYLCSIL